MASSNLTHLHKLEKLIVPIKNGNEFVDALDIIYCKSDNVYTDIYMKGGHVYRALVPICKLEETLKSDCFVRTHKSYIVNICKIKTYIKKEGGYLILTSGKHIPLSRSRKEEFLRRVDLL